MAAEKGLKRLWEAYEILKKLETGNFDAACRYRSWIQKINTLINEFDEFMNDDFNTAKVLANMFEIVPVINSLKDGVIKKNAISSATLNRMKELLQFTLKIFSGLQSLSQNTETFNGVMQLLADIRKEARTKKDFLTSDKIRNQLAALGIEMKDEKDGSISWNAN